MVPPSETALPTAVLWTCRLAAVRWPEARRVGGRLASDRECAPGYTHTGRSCSDRGGTARVRSAGTLAFTGARLLRAGLIMCSRCGSPMKRGERRPRSVQELIRSPECCDSANHGVFQGSERQMSSWIARGAESRTQGHVTRRSRPRAHSDLMTVAIRGEFAGRMRRLAESQQMGLGKLPKDAPLVHRGQSSSG